MFTFCQNDNDKERIVKSINIKKVDFEIMTFNSVECNSYEKSFKDYLEFNITNISKIDSLNNLFQVLDHIDSTYSATVDVRAKLTFTYSDNKNEIICVGNLTTDKGGVIFITTDELRNFLSNL